jgi:plastocyanin
VRFAALAAAAVLVAVAAAPSQAAVAPSRVQVSAKEFWFSLSRKSVVEGPAIVELVNFGEDPHDMRLRRLGGTRTYRTPLVQPGAYFDLSVKLAPGRYTLWCAVANHEALGMKAVLTVRKK